MSSTIQRHGFAYTEIRSQSGDGRTLDILAVKFDVADEIGSVADGYGFYETFDRHSFDETLRRNGPAKIRLLAHHDMRSNPVGVLTDAWTDNVGVHVTARLSDTTQGRDTATLIADGALTDVSIGFRDVKSTWSDHNRRVLRQEVAWRELSIVNLGALADAKILASRSDTRTLSAATAQRRLRLLDL